MRIPSQPSYTWARQDTCRHKRALCNHTIHKDRSDVIKNMLRGIGVPIMVDAAADRWPLPKLCGTERRHSAAYFVAIVITRHGVTLGERQVRRMYKNCAKLAPEWPN